MTEIGVGVIGFGWMGQAHSRAYRDIPVYYGDSGIRPRLAAVADNVPARLDLARDNFGFGWGTLDWHELIDRDDVDVVDITAPNALHQEIAEAAAAAGKHIFCEKPVGISPEATAAIERAGRHAGIISGCGYNYRWAPLVQYARQLIADGTLGEITNYRGRFFSMYGSDPLNPLSWRYRVEEGGYGASTDLLSHSVDLAHMLLGPITRVVGTVETFIRERPVTAGGTHYARGSADDPLGPVTNEDYAGLLCEFAGGARGTFEASRTIVGPESQMAFEVYGTWGALRWNLERLNELQVYLAEDELHTGYRTVFGGDRFPYHGSFVPGSANGIGFEDLVVIEDLEFLRSMAERRPHQPGFEEALACGNVQAALLRSVESETWEAV